MLKSNKIMHQPMIKGGNSGKKPYKRKSETKPCITDSDDDVIFVDPHAKPKRARQENPPIRKVAVKEENKKPIKREEGIPKHEVDSSDDDVIIFDQKPENKANMATQLARSVNIESSDFDSDDGVTYLDLSHKEIIKNDSTARPANSEKVITTLREDSGDSDSDDETTCSKVTTEIKLTTQAKKEKVSPPVKKEKVTSQVKKERTTPQMKKEKVSSRVKKERMTPQVKKGKVTAPLKKENSTRKELASESSLNVIPQHVRKPLLDIKDWKPSSQVKGDADDVKPLWSDPELLAEKANIQPTIAKNLVDLFESGNTIPFIARYRRDVTDDMSPERLREVREHFEELCELKTRMKTVVKNIEKIGELRQELRHAILATRTTEELEHIYAPFKPGGKRTLAEKAKELGLEEPSMALLNGTSLPDLGRLVEPNRKELKNLQLVEKGIVHIIAAAIAADTEMLAFMRNLRKEGKFQIESKKIKTKSEKAKTNVKGVPDESKYQLYFDFKTTNTYIKPHQVLAINRGECQKILSVKICVPDYMERRFKGFCADKWNNSAPFDFNRNRILKEAIDDSYNRLVQPLIIREVRAELKQMAEKASGEVFSTNLKHLLLAPPLKGKTILGIDPGFSKGCKLALVSTTGSLLDYGVVYPHTSKVRGDEFLKMLLQKHNCDLIALGNGTACRETEQWLSDQIQSNYFSPLNVSYTIVNESGASIYSCSAEAKKEFPDLDPNIVSAVSLARRVQEPLAELVKVEPQHLGVGMYQHDLKKKYLEQSLSEVLSECVSFVGVDLNTASQCLLRRIAGLTDKRATEIITYREKNGPFTHRKQLTDVKGIGPRVFQQCSGFLRVGPTDLKEAVHFYKKPNTTKLDCTYIHPESYDIANKILKKLKLDENDIGEPSFICRVAAQKSDLNVHQLSDELNCTAGTVRLILDSLSMALNHDLRSECKVPPLFKKGLTSINDLSCGAVLTGCVTNVTHFGCFVDVGVGTEGLIHSSRMRGLRLQIGDRVETKVDNIDLHRRRIGLLAVQVLN